jgi:protein involved in polysaccharide export with SLBB domain
MPLPSRRPACGLVLLVLLALRAAPAPAQTLPALSFEEQRALAAQQARQQAMERILEAGSVPLEGALDPADYVVGPGDVFSVAVGGGRPAQYALVVTADGALVLPEVGSLRVAGLSLAEARVRAEGALRQAYRNVATEVALAQPRQFYVHVSGEVERPGRHVMVPIARVEDAVSAGMDGRSPLVVLREQKADWWSFPELPALRNVEVRRQDGARFRVDLLRYYATGDPEHNPYLLDGDAVFVPAVARDGDGLVYVEPEGAVSTEDRLRRVHAYDFRPGDTVLDLLLVAGGPELVARTGQARLLRTAPDGSVSTEVVDVAALRAGAAPPIPLQPLDRLQLPEPAERAGAAVAEGYVAFPGTYPIVEGETTLRDLVAAAGGVRPEGLLRGAYLERRGEEIAAARGEGEFQSLEAMESVEERATLLEQETFEAARLSALSFGSRQYMVREMLQFQRVSLDLGDDPASIPPVPLRDGDRFVVPRDPGAVLVIGQVRRPGYVPYAAGADAEHYIAQAGGMGPAATAVYVREAGSGYLREPGAAPIRSGDAVFVDRDVIADTEALQALALQEAQLELQRAQEARTSRFQFIQTGLSVLGTAVAVVTTYLLITRDTSGN